MTMLRLAELLVLIILFGAIAIGILFKIASDFMDFAEAKPLQLMFICLIIVVILFFSL